MKNVFRRWLPLWILVLAGTCAGANDLRFSQSLNTEDRGASGITRLSSDEVAVVDALVRRDTAARGGASNNDKVAATFSERLTADERRTAGLQKITTDELPKLNGFVERYQNGALARTLLAPPTYLSRYSRVTPLEKKKEREIHGSFSLSYGFGSSGYSEKTGSTVLTLEDPDKGYSISIGYSESHVKGGGYIYRDPLYRDPFYRDPFNRDPLYRDPLYDSLRSPLDGAVSPLRP